MNILAGLFIPFIGTILGSSMVYFMKDKMDFRLEKVLLGFASGVMVAASVFSLLIPSIEMSKQQNLIAWIPASLGFIVGIIFLLFLDTLIPHLHIKAGNQEGINTDKLKKTTMMFLAVTLHNIPESMAVGVSLAGLLNNNVSFASVLVLSIGIAIQNFPEGAIISMPLKEEGFKKSKAFLMGVLSGIVEPIFGYITLLLTSTITVLLPYSLSFAAGAMFYVVVEELIPESQYDTHSNAGTIGFAIGFVIMMILDIALG